MSLNKTDIEQIAWLARLAIAEDDIPNYASNLSDILELVEQMNAINTKDILPLAHPLEITTRLREDKITEQDQREHFQSIAPQVEDGHYLVPKVIE